MLESWSNPVALRSIGSRRSPGASGRTERTSAGPSVDSRPSASGAGSCLRASESTPSSSSSCPFLPTSSGPGSPEPPPSFTCARGWPMRRTFSSVSRRAASILGKAAPCSTSDVDADESCGSPLGSPTAVSSTEPTWTRKPSHGAANTCGSRTSKLSRPCLRPPTRTASLPPCTPTRSSPTFPRACTGAGWRSCIASSGREACSCSPPQESTSPRSSPAARSPTMRFPPPTGCAPIYRGSRRKDSCTTPSGFPCRRCPWSSGTRTCTG